MAIALFPDCQSFFSHTLALASSIFLEPVLKDMRKKRERNEKETRKKRERNEKETRKDMRRNGVNLSFVVFFLDIRKASQES
jgi:hypothetical protein